MAFARRPSEEVVLLASLQFFCGVLWSVQRPQGFLVVYFLSSGISEGGVGLLAVSSLAAQSIGGPLIGILADQLKRTQRHRVLAASILLRALCQLAAWPAVGLLHGPAAFWTCLLAVSAAATWNAGAILAETTIRMVGSDGFGRVRLWGGIGFAAGSLCTGVLDQRLPDLGLSVVFLEGTAVSILCAAAIMRLAHLEDRADAARAARLTLDAGAGATGAEEAPPVEEAAAPAGPTLATRALHFVCQGHVLLFLAVVFALGLGEGVMSMYTYVRLNELPHGTSTVMGLSAVFMIISEVPFFYYSGPLVTRFGAMPILAVALACQFARQLWIACLWDARWVLPGELLHGLTYSVANAALTVYIRQIAPPELRNTAQAILSTVFVGLGQGAASLLGGFMIQRFGTVALFRASALCALCVAALPASLSLVAACRQSRECESSRAGG